MPDDTISDDTMPDDAPTPDTAATMRLGVVRPPDATDDVTVATMEARVVRAEIERRLGAVTLDLRTAGTPTGPWRSLDHAAWPGDVDATIDLGDLGGPSHDLIAIFGRTVDPDAAEVRRRMLEHLSILPVGDRPLTDDLLDELLPPPARPTDLWLVIRDASQVATSEPAHERLGADRDRDDGLVERLDRWFDAAVAGLEPSGTTIARLRAEVAELRDRLAGADEARVRAERSVLERLDDLATECASLRERLERTTLDLTAHAEGPRG